MELLAAITNETFKISIETMEYQPVNYTIISKSEKEKTLTLKLGFQNPSIISAKNVGFSYLNVKQDPDII